MKYLIVDLDDTLLTTEKKITEYTILGLDKLRMNGFKIVANTARSYDSAKEYLEVLKPDYSILNGGAQIMNSDNVVIYNRFIDKNHTNYILNKVMNDKEVRNCSVEGENGYYSMNAEYVARNPLATYFDFNNEFPEGAYKILLTATNNHKWRDLAIELGYQYEIYFDGEWFRLSNSTKYLGNLALFNLLSDSNPEDYVFGDDNGDIEMIKKSYHGVIMSNARHDLKHDISNVTDYDNNCDGVIKYMEKILGI